MESDTNDRWSSVFGPWSLVFGLRSLKDHGLEKNAMASRSFLYLFRVLLFLEMRILCATFVLHIFWADAMDSPRRCFARYLFFLSIVSLILLLNDVHRQE